MITLERQQGTPIEKGTYTATPETWTLTIRPPWGGGLVYNRPASVLVQQGGAIRRIPIRDATLIALIAIGVISTLVIMSIGGHNDG